MSITTPSHQDFVKHQKHSCHCKGGLVGIPVAYWQPQYIVEVTTTPYHLVAFGGMKLTKPTIKKMGSRHAYHVHYYAYPAFILMGLANQFVCASKETFNIGYMSEFDPFWFDDAWNSILYPETFLFSTPLAHAACLPDCLTSTLHKPNDTLFWCAGCQGSLFPYNGFVSHVRGGVQASSLIVHRMLAKLHKWGYAKTFEKGNYCEKTFSRYPRKTAYKIQLALPIKQTARRCPALGGNEYDWGFAKSSPWKGGAFAYIIWERAHCCVDPYKIATKAVTGGVS